MDIAEFLADVVRNIERTVRPKDLPPNVPDCGWNHGEDLRLPPKEHQTPLDEKFAFR
jgi:hypothetical protein